MGHAAIVCIKLHAIAQVDIFIYLITRQIFCSLKGR
jgi:hypothetical protein